MDVFGYYGYFKVDMEKAICFSLYKGVGATRIVLYS